MRAAARAVDAAGDAGGPEVRGVVARVALRQPHPEVLGLGARHAVEVAPHNDIGKENLAVNLILQQKAAEAQAQAQAQAEAQAELPSAAE